MDQTASANSDRLYWLDRIQDTDRDQVGKPFLQLGKLQKSGCPIRAGLVVPDAVMQGLWTQIRWPDQALQDFPYLRLQFSAEQALQQQQMAEAIQRGILDLDLPPDWAAVWELELSSLGSDDQQLLLTPSLWTTQPDLAAETLQMPDLEPCFCRCQAEAVWLGLKQLWASLFQAGNLFIFQYLGLRPETLHLSVLLQVLPPARLTGWAVVSSTHLQVQSSTHLSFNTALAQDWPDLYCYERRAETPRWQRVNAELDPAAWAWGRVFQTFIELAPVLERHIGSAAMAWVVPDTDPLSLEFLGLKPELPFPMPAGPQKLAQQSGLLGRGTAAAAGRLTAPAVVVDDFQTIAPSALRGSILVTRSLEPVHLAWLQQAAGLLCETGGRLSHSAILARESGCPAIVGVEGITSQIRTGQWITLDGGTGEICAGRPANKGTADGSQALNARLNKASELSGDPALNQSAPHSSRVSATATQVLVNLSQPERLDGLEGLAVDGIGLIRGEWLLGELLLGKELHQSGSDGWLQGERRSRLKLKLKDSLTQMVERLGSQPVFYRAVDLYAADWNRLEAKSGAVDEMNPALGLRGALRYLTDSRLLDLELETLKALINEGATTLRLILPFVRSPQEVRYCAQKLHQLGLQDRLPLWMMAEVPSVLMNLEAYQATGAAGLTIGLSDFTQLLLGTDRDLPIFDTVRDQQQQTVLQAVVQLVQHATALGLPSILCGALDPSREWLEPLIEAGLTGITVEVGAVTSVREVVSQTEQQLRSRSGSSW